MMGNVARMTCDVSFGTLLFFLYLTKFLFFLGATTNDKRHTDMGSKSDRGKVS